MQQNKKRSEYILDNITNIIITNLKCENPPTLIRYLDGNTTNTTQSNIQLVEVKDVIKNIDEWVVNWKSYLHSSYHDKFIYNSRLVNA